MSSHALSDVRHFRACNAGIPASLEMDAIISTITEGWDWGCIEATAREGVAAADSDVIEELIREEELTITLAEAECALLEYCRERVAQGK